MPSRIQLHALVHVSGEPVGLPGQVTALAGLGRAIAGGPVGRLGALAYGVRHAVSLRRTSRRTLPGRVMERRVMERGELTRSEAKR